MKTVYTDQTAGAQTVPVQQNSASAAGSRTTAVQTTATEAVTTAQETASVTEAAEEGTTITASAAKTTTSETATTKATTTKAATTKATTTKATTTKATTTKATTTKATTTKATTTKTTTTKATTTKATTTKATTTTVTTTATEPQPWMRAVDSLEQANIVLPDAAASPGQTVRVDVVMTEDISVAGFQFSLMPEYVSGGVMPYFVQWNVDEIIALDMKDPVVNVLDPEKQFDFIICGAKASEILFPEGTKLFTLEVGIPEDAVPGQVFRFKEGELPIKFTGEGGDPEDVIPVRCYFGSITVI